MNECFQQDDFWDQRLYRGSTDRQFHQDFVAQGYGILTLNPKKASGKQRAVEHQANNSPMVIFVRVYQGICVSFDCWVTFRFLVGFIYTQEI